MARFSWPYPVQEPPFGGVGFQSADAPDAFQHPVGVSIVVGVAAIINFSGPFFVDGDRQQLGQGQEKEDKPDAPVTAYQQCRGAKQDAPGAEGLGDRVLIESGDGPGIPFQTDVHFSGVFGGKPPVQQITVQAGTETLGVPQLPAAAEQGKQVFRQQAQDQGPGGEQPPAGRQVPLACQRCFQYPGEQIAAEQETAVAGQFRDQPQQ